MKRTRKKDLEFFFKVGTLFGGVTFPQCYESICSSEFVDFVQG